jgi:hypothetical protein
MEERVMEQHRMHWTEVWLRTSIGRLAPQLLRQLVSSRQRASIMAEEAVWIGVVATVGVATVAAFMSGLGGVLQKALSGISGHL